MNLIELQAELRHFAAERDWQPFHTPKNLSTALMVEAAELAEVFQWMTPEESLPAMHSELTQQRIGEEVADVLLYLLQLADHSGIHLEHAVRDKMARNAVKHPAKRQITRASPAQASVPGTHVLLDYENVQPSDIELRALVPKASQVWVFHGPHQRDVSQRFASFGTQVTAVPISQTGKNALDFHLSFYMGYIASRNAKSPMVVVANDKGYEPMLAHAKALGFEVRRQAHGAPQPAAKQAPAKKKAAAPKVPAKKSVAAQPAAKPPAKPVAKLAAKPTAKPPSKQAQPQKVTAKTSPPPKGVSAPAAKKRAPTPATPSKKVSPAKQAVAKAAGQAAAGTAGNTARVPATPPPARSITVNINPTKKITDSLRKMGTQRPTKADSLRRLLKSLLNTELGDHSIDVAIQNLMAAGVAVIGAENTVSYPAFETPPSAEAKTP
ncbi:MAG: hypothetical protein RJA98_1117 [Pseudomonadota bacterium]